MSKDTSRVGGSATEMGLTLEQLIRRGARDLIQNAIEVEVRELLVEYGNVRTLSGAAAVVRNGYLPAREILTAVGPVEVRVMGWSPLPETASECQSGDAIFPPTERGDRDEDYDDWDRSGKERDPGAWHG